ncbi:MAG: hypothetical protein LBB12_02130 [Holosporaceae bacterium]|nr:hypothetical protein [Holosporaceae bacterium]
MGSGIRQALYMSAVSAIKSNPKVTEFYSRLRLAGKPAFVALTAVARKMLVILNAKMRLFYAGETVF